MDRHFLPNSKFQIPPVANGATSSFSEIHYTNIGVHVFVGLCSKACLHFLNPNSKIMVSRGRDPRNVQHRYMLYYLLLTCSETYYPTPHLPTATALFSKLAHGGCSNLLTEILGKC